MKIFDYFFIPISFRVNKAGYEEFERDADSKFN